MGMNGDVFEYFFEPEELEPYLSELRPPSLCSESVSKSVPTQQPGDAVRSTVATRKPRVAVTALHERVLKKRELAPVDVRAVDCVAAKTTIAAESKAEQAKSNIDDRLEIRNPSRIRHFLSVHALGQFLFCPRSAILAAERGDERDVDEPLPRLTYLPNFDRERIEEELKKKLHEIGFSVAFGVVTICLMVVSAVEQNRPLFFVSMFACIATLSWCVCLSVVVARLAIRRRAAIIAEAREPDPEVLGIQQVNWWSMLKCGFEPVNYDRPLRHPEYPLEGCPWRVLERDSVRIPVIRTTGAKLGNEKGKLYPKHQIRLVAYALLLEAAGHIDVPYGLIFPGDSPRGLAFQITDELRQETIQKLREFWSMLSQSKEHHIEPSLPAQQRKCHQCAHGYPQLIPVPEINRQRKQGNQVIVLMNGRGKTYHCDCGNRFGTAPPHARSLELGLVASLQ